MTHPQWHDGEPVVRLPRPPAPLPAPGAFFLCPSGLLPPASAEFRAAQEWLYRVALEQAQEVARPSLPERDLLGGVN